MVAVVPVLAAGAFLFVMMVAPALAASAMRSDLVKNTLTYEQVGLIRMATGGEMVLRRDDGTCMRTRAHPPKDKQIPRPNIEVDQYACAKDGSVSRHAPD